MSKAKQAITSDCALQAVFIACIPINKSMMAAVEPVGKIPEYEIFAVAPRPAGQRL
jgi:hypothetical protein